MAATRLKRILDQSTFLAGRLFGVLYADALRPAAEVMLTDTDNDKIALDELLEIALEKARDRQRESSTHPPYYQ